ncbi:nickel ABC transporter permease subunit NikC [Allokutzneria multivorans]|uniref:Nickel ABC transporter permease subunit NikC n=1 Tax=Allokutzneria multivorans TaxID=1142134 RepID=A0ABP7U337_9PSEU
MNRLLGIVLAALLGVLAFVVPFLTPDPNGTEYGAKLAAPSWAHLLGTDQAGRDVLARIAAGTWVSLGTALLVAVITFAVGLAVGMLAALAGGVVDTVISRVIDVTLAVPQLVLALAIVGVLGPGHANLVLAMSVAGWAHLARFARAFASQQTERPFVIASRMSGVGRWRSAARHVMPATATGVLAVATLHIGEIVLSLAGLSFLGLGVSPPTAEWGQMVAEARGYVDRAPWLVLAPAVAVLVSVAAASLLGDALQDRGKR